MKCSIIVARFHIIQGYLYLLCMSVVPTHLSTLVGSRALITNACTEMGITIETVSRI